MKSFNEFTNESTNNQVTIKLAQKSIKVLKHLDKQLKIYIKNMQSSPDYEQNSNQFKDEIGRVLSDLEDVALNVRFM